MITKRLGKGLGALIRPPEKQDVSPAGVTKISISKVKMNPHQPRKLFDEKTLAELEASIREKGVITPITVRTDGGLYPDRWRKAATGIQIGATKRNPRLYNRSHQRSRNDGSGSD